MNCVKCNVVFLSVSVFIFVKVPVGVLRTVCLVMSSRSAGVYVVVLYCRGYPLCCGIMFSTCSVE